MTKKAALRTHPAAAGEGRGGTPLSQPLNRVIRGARRRAHIFGLPMSPVSRLSLAGLWAPDRPYVRPPAAELSPNVKSELRAALDGTQYAVTVCHGHVGRRFFPLF